MQLLTSLHQALQAAIVDVYSNLTRDQLVLFLSIRSLSVDGSSIDLANRLAKHDLETYHASPLLQSFPAPPEISPEHPPSAETLTGSKIPALPAEIIAEIMDHVGDWELARAVGTVTSLRRPREWTRASLVDEAALSGSLLRIQRVAASSSEPSTSTALPESSFATLTQVGANAIIRLGYIHLLQHLRLNERAIFDRLYGGPNHSKCIPRRASAAGRTEVLTWWRAATDIPKVYGAECIDEASQHGQLNVLDWWWDNSLPNHLPPNQSHQPNALTPLHMLYTEAALENASAQGHTHVLTWWARSGLPLRVGRVMDLASKMGHTEVLEWWLRSGIEVKYDSGTLEHASRSGRVDVLSWWLGSGYRLMFNEEVLLSATRHNRPEVLQWWCDSGLSVQYRICDIEEALEDAIRPGLEAREWWRKTVDFNANNAEWIKVKTLR
ncbi:hypothetical protein DL93DRAFT_2049909 [Clavulina sp. PMI_390]|nr:hypothetical protein DL93DRAFT_2049909 [Clavulina sp. PMI_390]